MGLLLALPELQRNGHAHGQSHRLRPGPNAALLMPAEHQRMDGHVAAENQGTDAERAAELVGGDAHRGDPQAAEIDGQLPGHLHRVGVQRHPAIVADCRQLGNRLEHAGFVVAQHHARQSRLGRKERGEHTDADDPVRGHAQAIDAPTLVQQLLGGPEDAGVLDRGDHDLGARGWGLGAGRGFRVQGSGFSGSG